MNPLNHRFSAQEIAQFERDGYVIARGLTPAADCAAMRVITQRDVAAEKLMWNMKRTPDIRGHPYRTMCQAGVRCAACCKLTRAIRFSRTGR